MRTISITQSPSIAVIQGTCEWLCAQERHGNEVHLGGGNSSSMIEYRSIYSPPPQIALPTQPPIGDWLKFKKLAAEWKAEKGARSSITQAALCRSYLSIIAMGEEKAVPFILAQLKSEGDDPDQWFLALRVLTDVDPVADEDRGNYPKMAQAWLKWAEASEYARYLATR